MKKVFNDRQGIKNTTYECDLTFERVANWNIHKVFAGNLCVSKEAVARLPEAFRRDDILERLIIASGDKGAGFLPEMLYEGVWMLSGNYLYCSTDVDNARFARRLAFLDTVAEAAEYIQEQYDGGDLMPFIVFDGGKLEFEIAPGNVPLLT